METLKEFEDMLKFHDWYYMYSDHYGTWNKGKNSRQGIRLKMKELETQGLGEEAKELFDTYNPHNK